MYNGSEKEANIEESELEMKQLIEKEVSMKQMTQLNSLVKAKATEIVSSQVTKLQKVDQNYFFKWTCILTMYPSSWSLIQKERDDMAKMYADTIHALTKENKRLQSVVRESNQIHRSLREKVNQVTLENEETNKKSEEQKKQLKVVEFYFNLFRFILFV